MGLHVRDEAVGVAALLLMPDYLVEDELVADVGVARRHEAREDGEVVAVAHGVEDGPVVAVAEDDPAAHQVVRVRHLVEHLVELLDAELLEQLPVVGDGRRAPRVERRLVGPFSLVPPSGSMVRRRSGRRLPPRSARLAAVLVGRCVVVVGVVRCHGCGRLAVSHDTGALVPVGAKRVRFGAQSSQ